MCAVGHHTDSFNRELTLKSQCPKDRGVFDPGAHLHSQMHLHHVIFKKFMAAAQNGVNMCSSVLETCYKILKAKK